MKQIGVVNELEVLRFTSVGAYLNAIDESSDTDVLLPTKYVPDTVQIGDLIEVFLYRDSEDRLIATTLKPALLVGQIGRLKVVDTNQYGAFLDWGLEKDLFLPFKEQTHAVRKGEWVVVMLYEDISERLSATMRIGGRLKTDLVINIGDWTEGTIYQIHEKLGAFVAVQNRYHGLIPLKECFGKLEVGQSVKVRVMTKKTDGKLDLALRERVDKQIFSDTTVLENALKAAPQNFLPYNDQTDPEIISKALHMSKRAFKRAVGVLLKKGDLEIVEQGIKLLTNK